MKPYMSILLLIQNEQTEQQNLANHLHCSAEQIRALARTETKYHTRPQQAG